MNNYSHSPGGGGGGATRDVHPIFLGQNFFNEFDTFGSRENILNILKF